jgi:hypothetical protein
MDHMDGILAFTARGGGVRLPLRTIHGLLLSHSRPQRGNSNFNEYIK